MMRSWSSDSDVGEVVKNLQGAIIKSEDGRQGNDKKYAYKRKLGDLVFDANFETGNLGLVEQINQYDYDLMVRPDCANPRARLWFNFTVSNQLPNQCVIFTFVNFSDSLRLFHEGLTPVVRTRLQPNWVRLHEDQVFYYKSANHGNRYVLSLAFKFTTYDNTHQFALSYPYSYTNLVSLIDRWSIELKRACQKRQFGRSCSTIKTQAEQKSISPHIEELRIRSSLGFYRSAQPPCVKAAQRIDFRARQLGTSILSKTIYLLSIKGMEKAGYRSRVVMIGRTRGNLDTVASFVCQGSMDYLLSDNLIARVARHYIDFDFIPMIDPDSISVGNSKTDIMGQTNITARMLNENPSLYSNYLKVQEFVKSICQETSKRVVVIELRVNLSLIGSRLIGRHYENDLARMERHLSFPRLLSHFADDFYLEDCEFRSSFTNSSLFDVAAAGFNVDHYLYETSPFAFYKRSLLQRSYQDYNQRKYLSTGKAIVFALLDLLRPKEEELPYAAAKILDNFHPKSDDIDDLLMKDRSIGKDI